MNIRFAALEDGPQMDKIYAYYIEHTVATFLLSSTDAQSFSDKIKSDGHQLPYLVAEEEGLVTGYAYASFWRYKKAYRWDVELSVYVKKGAEHRGIGKKLYKKLLALLTLQGYKMAYAGITLPNEASVGLHQKFGFTTVGVFKNTGYKHNTWLDVLWMEKELNPTQGEPREPKTIEEVKKQAGTALT